MCWDFILSGSAAALTLQRMVKEPYYYVCERVSKETRCKQHPELIGAKGDEENANACATPTFTDARKIKVKFLYGTPDNQIREFTDNSVLKSGQHVGVAFKAESDCHTFLGGDSSGQVARLCRNHHLT
jgi:hypothetical protein